MMDPIRDGITHINIYSQGRTELGRFLSNFAHTPIITEDGPFESIEGYWYWLGCRDDALRVLHGVAAKQYGRKCQKVVTLPHEDFQRKIDRAIRVKLQNNRQMYLELVNGQLPLTHYYVFNGVIKEAGHQWVVDIFEKIRKEAQFISDKKPHMFTAQYRYAGRDRLDITVKGNCMAGKYFAPTWDMVVGHKKGKLTDDQYTELYYQLLLDRWNGKDFPDFPETLGRMLNILKDRDMTFVCFCPSGKFCHRHLLVKWLQHNWDVPYGGERQI